MIKIQPKKAKPEAEEPAAPTKPISKVQSTATATITKEAPDGSIDQHTEQVPVKVHPVKAQAVVGVSAAITRNLGNYESYKVSVSLSVPCEAEAEDIDGTYDSVKEWVDDKLNALNEEITQNLG